MDLNGRSDRSLEKIFLGFLGIKNLNFELSTGDFKNRCFREIFGEFINLDSGTHNNQF